MRYNPNFATNILAFLYAAMAMLAFFGHRLSALLCRRVEERTPQDSIKVIGAGLRLRIGWLRQNNQFGITAIDCLRYHRGLSIGRGLLRRIRVRKVSEGRLRRRVSRYHARLDFDTTKKCFFIENTSSTNTIYWAPLMPDGSSPEDKEEVAGRKYLDTDLRLWLGEVPMDLHLLKAGPILAPNPRPGNVVAAWSIVVMQVLAVLLYCLGTRTIFLPLLLPGTLLIIAALSTLPRDCAFTPVPAMIFIALTCGWFFYTLFSHTPSDAAIIVTRSFFCIGAAVIYLLPDNSGEDEAPSPRVNWYCKAGGTIVIVALLYHYGIITTFNDSVLLLALVMSNRIRERKKLFQKVP